MWRRKRLSDAEFVERLRSNPQARRRAGGITLSTSLILCAFAGYFLQKVTTGEWRFSETPVEQWAFQFGAIVGSVCTMAMFGATLWFVWGFGMYFPDRREELLLEYHQRLTELGQLLIKTSGGAV